MPQNMIKRQVFLQGAKSRDFFFLPSQVGYTLIVYLVPNNFAKSLGECNLASSAVKQQ